MFSTKESILLSFDRIEKDDHQMRILFYEKHSHLIFTLEEEKQHYFTFHYLDSLFLSGKYENVLTEIDALIEYIFINNINYTATRTYEHLLYKKAFSLFKMFRFEEAIKISEQLVGIEPENKMYHTLLFNSYRRDLNFSSAGIRLTALILIFISAILSAVYWFVKNNGEKTTMTEGFLLVICPCFIAIGLLGGADLINYLRSRVKTSKLISKKLDIKTLKKF